MSITKLEITNSENNANSSEIDIQLQERAQTIDNDHNSLNDNKDFVNIPIQQMFNVQEIEQIKCGSDQQEDLKKQFNLYESIIDTSKVNNHNSEFIDFSINYQTQMKESTPNIEQSLDQKNEIISNIEAGKVIQDQNYLSIQQHGISLSQLKTENQGEVKSEIPIQSPAALTRKSINKPRQTDKKQKQREKEESSSEDDEFHSFMIERDINPDEIEDPDNYYDHLSMSFYNSHRKGDCDTRRIIENSLKQYLFLKKQENRTLLKPKQLRQNVENLTQNKMNLFQSPLESLEQDPLIFYPNLNPINSWVQQNRSPQGRDLHSHFIQNRNGFQNQQQNQEYKKVKTIPSASFKLKFCTKRQYLKQSQIDFHLNSQGSPRSNDLNERNSLESFLQNDYTCDMGIVRFPRKDQQYVGHSKQIDLDSGFRGMNKSNIKQKFIQNNNNIKNVHFSSEKGKQNECNNNLKESGKYQKDSNIRQNTQTGYNQQIYLEQTNNLPFIRLDEQHVRFINPNLPKLQILGKNNIRSKKQNDFFGFLNGQINEKHN